MPTLHFIEYLVPRNKKRKTQIISTKKNTHFSKIIYYIYIIIVLMKIKDVLKRILLLNLSDIVDQRQFGLIYLTLL